jgi:hypothetical protein
VGAVAEELADMAGWLGLDEVVFPPKLALAPSSAPV